MAILSVELMSPKALWIRRRCNLRGSQAKFSLRENALSDIHETSLEYRDRIPFIQPWPSPQYERPEAMRPEQILPGHMLQSGCGSTANQFPFDLAPDQRF